MRLFDFFRKKKTTKEDQVEASEVKIDIETQRQGYIELAEICLSSSRLPDFKKFVEELEDYSDDEEFMTTLNYVIDYLYRKGNSFIVCLDWKQEITSLSHAVHHNLKNNFDLSVRVPQQEDYGERASVSYDNVFKDFDKAINKEGFQLSFIDTNNDQYVLVVHKIKDLVAAKSAIGKIGYPCLHANSRKISG